MLSYVLFRETSGRFTLQGLTWSGFTQPGFNPGLNMFALAIITRFHPDIWNSETCGSIQFDVSYRFTITSHRWE